ncbi:MAG TPA: NAD(P)-binding protein [Streptosporangiaceae bacterium]|nr:NAD(P)-binding protein [Streptosporangiaceae bacterium]
MINISPEAGVTARDPRYDILFEPVDLGPVRARNRFFQVPHCNGMGYRDPTAQAAMRQVKAEGGWAVVCTEQVEIHPSSDITPFIELRLWDDGDLPALARIAEAIHAGGALAGIELAHNGMNSPNLSTREPPLGPAHLPIVTWANDPVQARMMSASDIADLRRWHRLAVRRALAAGYDVVYVYSGHNLSVLHHFLSRRYNQRTDSYGGSVANRARLLAEILEDTREECAGRAAVACRLTVDEGIGQAGITPEDAAEVISLLDHLPDLWDLVLGSWELDSATSRFAAEAEREPLMAGLKRLSAKPVVGVGRFTSPDTMVRQVRAGILDMIGAARPSIADPFLPAKIEAGRLDDIRECIGCNICISGDMTMSPIRCTQNPTMGEEWRRGWHPERIRPKESDASVLIVGAGPAGLEAARALGQRGYPVVLTEATRELGGRVSREADLPGLAAWRRVADYRLGQLRHYRNVDIYRESEITPEDALGYGFTDILVATGARWRADGVGRWHTSPIPVAEDANVLTPDDLLAGDHPLSRPGTAPRRILVFDDDHYYLGGVLAELLARAGHETRLVTPAPLVSSWTAHTLEIGDVQRRVREAGITVDVNRALTAIGTGGEARTACVFTGSESRVRADVVLLVTARLPRDDLFLALEERRDEWPARGVRSVTCIGDAWAPSTIAGAVWSGRRYAEEFDAPGPPSRDRGYRREYTALGPLP